MRDIEFRVWDIQRKRLEPVEMMYYRDDSVEVDYVDSDKEPFLITPETGIIEQYIGKNDRKGKKIFEGDYVRYLSFICVVEFTQGSFILKCINKEGFFYFADMASNMLRVTGNIHEGDEE